MRFFWISAFSLVVAGAANAEPLVSCGEEKGTAYYIAQGAVTPKDAGWTDDAISGGSVTLEFKDGKLDLLFFDASKRVQSSIGGGAEVTPLALGEQNITILVSYKGETTEIYDFYVNSVGEREFTHLVSKPANLMVPKAALYVGKCQTFDLAPLNKWLQSAGN